jgi:8-oxo-dGTP diphosphatase
VAVTVDLVIATIRSGQLCVLLVERGEEPFRGQAALPGGFVRPDEDLADAARRELAEETGVDVGEAGALYQLGAYGAPSRDPRMRVVTVAHVALLADLPEPAAGTDAAEARLVSVSEATSTRLAFDHDEILAEGIAWVRRRVEETSAARRFCPPEFTMRELRSVYEAVWGCEVEPANLRRKLLAAGVVEPVPTEPRPSGPGGGRPATLYRATSTGELALDPPLRRPSSS